MNQISTDLSNRQLTLYGPQGPIGRLEMDQSPDASRPVTVILNDGERMIVAANAIERQSDGRYFMPISVDDLKQLHGGESLVIPVARESLHVERISKVTSRTIVHVEPRTRQESVDVALRDEAVEIERVAINRPVDAPTPTRQEGDITIIPVFAEVLVVTKQLMLKEEIRITRKQTSRQHKDVVELRSEEVRIERVNNSQV